MDYSSAASPVILLFHCIAYHLLVEFFFYSFIVSSFIVLKEMLRKINKQHEQNCWVSRADHASV